MFLTTKLWRSHQGPDVLPKLKQSLRRLRTGHVDLWLLHWPGPGQHRFKRHQVVYHDCFACGVDTAVRLAECGVQLAAGVLQASF